ncbi:MAG: hypothetical protein ABIR36_15145 [Nitrospiraceae bacterium]
MFLRTVEEELPRKDDEIVELVIAARAEGGLQILNERRINLVISDVRLPGMSGLDCYSACKPRIGGSRHHDQLGGYGG